MNLLKTYTYLPKACARVDGQLSESFSIKKGVRYGLSSPLTNFFLSCSLMTFLINVINMESLLVINFVVEVSLQMTMCYVLQQDLNLRNC